MKTYSPAKSVPNPTPLLFIAAAAVSWVLLTGDAGIARPFVIGAVALPVAGCVVYFFSRSVGAALWGLLAAALMSRYYLEVGGLKARPEHIIIGLLCVAALFYWKRRTTPVRWIVADWYLLGYIGMNIFSSLVMSVAPSQTLKWALQQTLVILAYFLLRIIAGEPQTFRRSVRILVAVGALEGAYAVVCFFSNLLFKTSFGVEVGQYGDFPGTYGTLYEANFLGAFSAACLVMAMVMYFQERARKSYLVAVALTYAGMVIALSRAAIIACAVALVVLFFAGRKTRIIDRRGAKAVALTLVGASVLLASATVPLYIQRFSKVQVSDVSADAETAIRVVSIGIAIDDIAQHPVLGNGTASFQLLVSNRELGLGDLEMGTWVGNVEIRMLHDTGLAGFAFFLGFLIYVALPAWKLLRNENHPELMALMLAALVYSMTFQATEGTLLAFAWAHLGLIACAVSIYHLPVNAARQTA